MKKLIYIIPILSLTLFSCKEDIDPSLDGKTTAVIYGLLDQNDTIHFVKINRAFYGSGNALETAKIADSSYFNSVKATVKEYQSGTLKRTWVLEDTLIQNKEDGAFFGPEQKLYYFKTTKNLPLIADEFTEYRFEAILDDGLSTACTVSGKTKLITGFKINDPKDQTNSGNFKFADNNGLKNTTIRIATGNAKKIDATVHVEFEEYVGFQLANTKVFSWAVGSAEESDLNDGVIEFTAQGSTFYDLVKDNVTADDAITKRILKSITLYASAADGDLQKYISVNKPSTGLTQNKPTFTNLSINNDMRIIGIFAARNTVNNYYYKWVFNQGSSYSRCIDMLSQKELCQGQITGLLKFCSDTPADASESFHCN